MKIADLQSLEDHRRKALEFLEKKSPLFRRTTGVVAILDNCLRECETRSRDPYFSVCMKAGVKAKYYWMCLRSLSLDGLGKESGANARVFMEYMNIIEYLRRNPDKAADFDIARLPKAGHIAAAVAPAFRPYRNYLNNFIAHGSLDRDSLDNIKSDEVGLLIDRPFSPDALMANAKNQYICLASLPARF